jgi:hypothetical protein
VTPNAVTGDAIEVTALGAPPSAAVTTSPATSSAQAAVPSASETAMSEPASAAAADDATAVETAATGGAEGPAEPAEAVPPPPPKSERQIACERKRGSWVDTGGGFMICITPTRDSGKRCTRESQCENVCLARSQTCAPVTPLMGCHEILQDDGSRATQCID